MSLRRESVGPQGLRKVLPRGIATVDSGQGDPGGTLAELRVLTAERLRTRREEIKDAVIYRALSVAPPTGDEAPGYVEALRAAIPTAIDYAVSAIELGEERVGPPPPEIAAQAAASAQSKVGLEVVLRRYASGYSTLSDFLHQEVLALAGDSDPGYRVMQRELTALFDRMVAEVSEAYRREDASSMPSPRKRQLERIRRLMAGDLIDPNGLDYPLDTFHVAVIVSGPDPQLVVEELRRSLGSLRLLGEDSERRCAAWLSFREPDPSQVEDSARELAGGEVRLSFGELGQGLSGWRRTRRQAEAAELVAMRSGEMVVRYRDVALLTAALRDPDLRDFLIETYVEPLRGDRMALAETVITFLRLNGNASSAAAALGISRHTVASRLRLAEERLGHPAEARAAQLETALRLAELIE